MAEKIIKNMPYLQHDSETGNWKLLQEQVTFVEEKKKVREFEETVVLIENVWEDLKNTNGEWKWNGKKYFYWECDVNSLEDEVVKTQIEAPAPTKEVFMDEEGKLDLEILDGDSDWAKYWKKSISGMLDNSEVMSKISEEKIEGQPNTTLVDYTPGCECFSEFDPNTPKTDDRDLINNLQSILF